MNISTCKVLKPVRPKNKLYLILPGSGLKELRSPLKAGQELRICLHKDIQLFENTLIANKSFIIQVTEVKMNSSGPYYIILTPSKEHKYVEKKGDDFVLLGNIE